MLSDVVLLLTVRRHDAGIERCLALARVGRAGRLHWDTRLVGFSNALHPVVLSRMCLNITTFLSLPSTWAHYAASR